MGKRENQRGKKLDRDDVVEQDEEEDPIRSSAVATSTNSSDEEAANEDLSLKIVEKALLMRAAKLVPDDTVSVEPEIVLNGPRESSPTVEEEISGLKEKKKSIKKDKKKKVKKLELANQNVVNNIEEKPEAIKVVAEATEPNPVGITDNIVLRKLLRGPRYFDPPDSSWGTCYNCGEEGHMAANCKSAKRKKPCFVCGSLEHNAKQCTKGQDCFICKKSGHRAKDCPDKHKGSSIGSKICLKCGYSGHDMFSCRNDYQQDDLKEICCYVCKSFGHLCCVDYVDSRSKVVSCYRCGQPGHTGLSCTRVYGETTGTNIASSCFKCGEEGHFARECTSTFKVGKRNREPSTPTLRFHREHRHTKEFKSAPHDLGKAHKKKKTYHELSGITTPQKSKHRGGWIMEDPGDFSFDDSRKKNWRSPATSSNRGHRNPNFRHEVKGITTPQKSKHRGGWIMDDPGDFSFDNSRRNNWRSPATPSSRGHVSTSQSLKQTRKVSGNSNFRGSYNAWQF